MINVFSHTFPTRIVLLEYTEDQDLEDFDLSIPLNETVIEQIIKPRYPELVEKLKNLHARDRRSGVMIDRYAKENNQPAIVSFGDPQTFFKEWGVEGVIDDSKFFYAAVVYPSRNNLVRVMYRNEESPKDKTDVYAGDGKFSHHEFIYTDSLPKELDWAHGKLDALKELGLNVDFNHYKTDGNKAKIYFKVLPLL